MQTSSARPAGVRTWHRGRARASVVRFVVVLTLLGVALAGSEPAVSAQGMPAPCRLLTPREIATRIGEKVAPGAPDPLVPGSCGYPVADAPPIALAGTGTFVRTVAVAVLDRAKCGSTRASTGRRPVRVGTTTGIYDTTGVVRVGPIVVHTVQLWVITHGHCLNLSWDRRPGPLPTGRAASRARGALLELGRLAIRRL